MVRQLAENKAGSYYVTLGSRLAQVNTSSAAINAGDAIFLDEADDNWKIAPVNAKGRRGIAVEAKAVGKTEIRVCVEGPADTICTGSIGPGRRVKISATTPGRVEQYVAAGTVADIDAYFGYFYGFGGNQNNNEGEGGPRTSAANGNVVTIWISKL